MKTISRARFPGMFVIEIVGPTSSGKTALANDIAGKLRSAGKRVCFPFEIVPIKHLLRRLKSEGLRNLCLEIFFLIRYFLPITRNYRSHRALAASGFNFSDKIKLHRSLFRKLGYDLLSNTAASTEGVMILDEGYYQILQNLITPDGNTIDVNSFIDRPFYPDLLIVVTANIETLISRSTTRKDLTSRYKYLGTQNLKKLLGQSKMIYEAFADTYGVFTGKTPFRLNRLEGLSIDKLETAGLIVFTND